MNFLFNRFRPSVESAQPGDIYSAHQLILLQLPSDIVPTWQSVPLPDGFESSLFRPLVLDTPLFDELIQEKSVNFLRGISTDYCLSFYLL